MQLNYFFLCHMYIHIISTDIDVSKKSIWDLSIFTPLYVELSPLDNF